MTDVNPPLRAQCSHKLQVPLMTLMSSHQPDGMLLTLINPVLTARWWHALRNSSIHLSEHDDSLKSLSSISQNLMTSCETHQSISQSFMMSWETYHSVSQSLMTSCETCLSGHQLRHFLCWKLSVIPFITQGLLTLNETSQSVSEGLTTSSETCQSLHLSFRVTSCEFDHSISLSWPDDVKWNITEHHSEVSGLDTAEQNLLVFTQTAVSFAKNCQSVHDKAWRHWVKLACHRTSCTVSVV